MCSVCDISSNTKLVCHAAIDTFIHKKRNASKLEHKQAKATEIYVEIRLDNPIMFILVMAMFPKKGKIFSAVLECTLWELSEVHSLSYYAVRTDLSFVSDSLYPPSLT